LHFQQSQDGSKNMAKPSSFAKPSTQAGKIMKVMQSEKYGGENYVKSVRTVQNFEQALTTVAANIRQENGGALRDLTRETAIQYLTDRASEVGQKTLDMERQAIQKMLQIVTHKIEANERLPVVKSEHQQVLESRAYTQEQVREIAAHQTAKNAISTEIAHAAGLRARPAHEAKFEGREGVSYTVTGKGGLTREIQLPRELSGRLEGYRLHEPEKVTDRGVHYVKNYNIGGGNAWSASFTNASKLSLGWSNGAHGLRHSYAQERMTELGRAGHSRDESLRIVSQEMGHFRPEITEVYLR